VVSSFGERISKVIGKLFYAVHDYITRKQPLCKGQKCKWGQCSVLSIFSVASHLFGAEKRNDKWHRAVCFESSINNYEVHFRRKEEKIDSFGIKQGSASKMRLW